MKYTKLGNSDLNVSRICMGCMGFGDAGRGQHSWTLDEEHSREIIKHGLELGVNFYDTAIGYQSGTSEQYVDKALKDFAKRDEVVVATKFIPRTQAEIENGVNGQQHSGILEPLAREEPLERPFPGFVRSGLAGVLRRRVLPRKPAPEQPYPYGQQEGKVQETHRHVEGVQQYECLPGHAQHHLQGSHVDRSSRIDSYEHSAHLRSVVKTLPEEQVAGYDHHRDGKKA